MNATFLRNFSILASAAGLAASAMAGPVLDRVRASGRVRVCIWSDYYGVTYRNPRTLALTGIDIDLSAEFGDHALLDGHAGESDLAVRGDAAIDC